MKKTTFQTTLARPGPMALFNPLQFLVFPFVFLVALPLALCAGFTTILAFMILFLRLFLVYFDVGLETLRYVLLGHAAQTRYMAAQRTPAITPSSSVMSSPISSPDSYRHPPFPHRQRKGSLAAAGGSGGNTPYGVASVASAGLDRDFEGIGGWRIDSVDVDTEAADDQQWYNLNSRLEIPDHRHHFRSQSGSALLAGTRATSRSPERLRMTSSPTSSRSRTPTNTRPPGFTKLGYEGYFQFPEGKVLKKVSV
ncbi:hypothetical protein GGR56DRAFT_211113 [Xylariaceae sp. FL0804]|nr:hypothetical protein GGR56DRAFT_211113 [Xylariaceae sp. FL0804]